MIQIFYLEPPAASFHLSTKISIPLQDGLAHILVQTIMVPLRFNFNDLEFF